MSYPRQALTICPHCQTSQSHSSARSTYTCIHCHRHYTSTNTSDMSPSVLPPLAGADYDRQLENRLSSLTLPSTKHAVEIILPPPSTQQLERRLSKLFSNHNESNGASVSDDALQQRLTAIQNNVSGNENIVAESLEQRLMRLQGSDAASPSVAPAALPVAQTVNANTTSIATVIDDGTDLETLVSQIGDEVRLENAKVDRVNDILAQPPRQRIHPKLSTHHSHASIGSGDSVSEGKMDNVSDAVYSVSEAEVRALMAELQNLPSTPNKLRSHQFVDLDKAIHAIDAHSHSHSEKDEGEEDDSAEVAAIVAAALDEARLESTPSK